VSGICGVLRRPEGPPVPPGGIEAMGRRLTLERHGEDVARRVTLAVGPAAFGVATFGRHRGGVARARQGEHDIAIATMGDFYDADAPGDDVAERMLARYLAEGIRFVEGIRGEALFAIWDGRTEELHLSTDRFRIHSLYVADRPDQFAFASRTASLFASPIPLRGTLRPDAIVDAVGTSIIPTPRTAFHEVAKVPPATRLTHSRGRTTSVAYWEIDFRNPSRAGEPALAKELRARFAEGIARRVRVDGDADRLGAFLSGGVDSSTVTGVLQQVAGRPMKSFSIGFGEARYNEITYARIAAEALRAQHFEYFVVPRDVTTALPTLLESFDEPYANASSIPTYFCAKLAMDHGVDVLYAGDGGDELFAGNERYATQRVFEVYGRIPRWLGRGVIEPVVGALADGLKWNLAVKGKKYIRRALLPAAKRLTSYDFLRVVPLESLLTPEFLAQVGKDHDAGAALEALHARAPGPTELDRQLFLDLHLTISDNDLVKVTRMTEAAGVTVRFPFLDQDLAAFAMTVPAAVKMRGRHLRTFFKRAYADILPPEVRSKSKHGFGLPIAEWLKTDAALAEIMRDAVLGPRALARGYFRRDALEDLVARHAQDPTSFYGTTLWNLVLLELWLRRREEEGRART
jgi:asparagine synthase (glutamine-hydrolysing)